MAKIKINNAILRQCRDQIGLTPDEVIKKAQVRSIANIESGEKLPTFKQLDRLSELYEVPRWVFIADSLPERYRFDRSDSAFRQFKDGQSDVFNNYKVRRLMVRVETLRSDIIELRQDMDEPIAEFKPPVINSKSAQAAADIVRGWLATKNSFDFSGWRERLEDKGIFIFMTSKWRNWSHIDKSLFRGLTLYYQVLPVIIINDSDVHKAQTFTLFHELGHLLQKKSAIDDWGDNVHEMEKWCDEFAGIFLMPEKEIQQRLRQEQLTPITSLDAVKALADPFKVSDYAALVRLKQTGHISQDLYSSLEDELKKRYEAQRKIFQERRINISRKRTNEVQRQFGKIYINALFQTYHNQDMDIHRLCQALGLKRTADALKVGGKA